MRLFYAPKVRKSHLNNGVYPSDHVLEHLFFFGGQLRDQTGHTAGFQVGNSESGAQFLVFVDDTRPGEQMKDTAEKSKVQCD